MKKRVVSFLSHAWIQLGTAATLMFGVLSLQVAPVYGQQCSISNTGDVTLIVDQTDLIMSDDSDLVVTVEENLFATLMLEEASQALTRLIAEDSTVSATRLSGFTQAKSYAVARFAAVEPLSDAELRELAQLLNGGKPAARNKERIDMLLNRLQQAGAKFDGDGTTAILGRILDFGSIALGGARGNFLEGYSSMVGIAINGMQGIDSRKYERYKACRRSLGHDDCALQYALGEDGEKAKRRYELELLLEQVAQQTRNFFYANLGADACTHLKVLLAAWDRIDVADARCTAPPDNIVSSGDLLAVWGGARVPVRGSFDAKVKDAARYFSNRARFKFLETNGYLSTPNDGIGRGDVEAAIRKLQCP